MMFLRFRKPTVPDRPLDAEMGKVIENNIQWLATVFPQPQVHERKIFLPNETDFPIAWNGTKGSAERVLDIVAEAMQLDRRKLALECYDNGMRELDMGGSVIFLEDQPDQTRAAGLYSEENGMYHIAVDGSLLNRPDELVATLAHESAHAKLLGELKMEENDEELTDLATVFFGFGIFGANTACKFHQSHDRWGYGTQGYFDEKEWAHALAMMAFLRGEDSPEWASHLTKQVQKHLKDSLRFLIANEKEILGDGEA